MTEHYFQYKDHSEFLNDISSDAPLIKFTQKEYINIREHLKKSFYLTYYGFNNNDEDLINAKFKKEQEQININFWKVQDEWFYVSMHNYGNRLLSRYYKCDQLDGLFKCLDEQIILLSLNSYVDS